MALDTRYRPTRYSDVLGQEATATMLKEFVRAGRGFHQSYLFCGPWGSGKTTLGRILARSLLCEAPVDGEPCDKCMSCRAILASGRSEAFTEFDAASNSGKEDLARVIEENSYSTTSGKQRVYLFDECFTADTVLITPEGPRTIEHLVCTKYEGAVLSRSADGQVAWDPVTDWFDIGERDVVQLTFDNGVQITVTENQAVFTLNRGWVTAVDLRDDDDVDETALTGYR